MEKTYTVKPEYLDSFGPDATTFHRMDRDDIEMIARGWECSAEEVISMCDEHTTSKVYVVQEVNSQGETFGYRLNLKTLRDAAESILAYGVNNTYARDVATYETEEQATEAAKAMTWDARATRCCVGTELIITWHEIICRTVDEDGDEVDADYLGSFDLPSVDDVVNMLDPEDEDEDE